MVAQLRALLPRKQGSNPTQGTSFFLGKKVVLGVLNCVPLPCVPHRRTWVYLVHGFKSHPGNLFSLEKRVVLGLLSCVPLPCVPHRCTWVYLVASLVV